MSHSMNYWTWKGGHGNPWICSQVRQKSELSEDPTCSWDVEVKLLSCVQLFETAWTIAYQGPLPMGFSRQDTRMGCHFLLQGIFLTQGSNPGLPHCGQTLYDLSHQGMETILFGLCPLTLRSTPSPGSVRLSWIVVGHMVSISELMLECTTILAQNKDKGKCCGLRLRNGRMTSISSHLVSLPVTRPL